MTGALKLLFAFCVGLAFTCWLAAREARRASPYGPAASRLGTLGFGSALVAGGLALLVGRNWLLSLAQPTLPLPTLAALPQPAAQTPTSAAGLLAHLVIPALHLDELIVTVPFINGGWDTSRLGPGVGRLDTVGLYANDNQAIALTAHVSLSALEPGPFADLWTLPLATEIIYRTGGTDYVYAVSNLEIIAPSATDRLYVQGSQTLLLITCTDWDYLLETYRSRLLVQTVLVAARPTGTQP
ncbi:MAG: sortase [Anaerolineales bacterium]